MPDLFRSYHDIHSYRIPATDNRLNTAQRRCNWHDLSLAARSDLRFRFFAHCKRRRKLRLAHRARLHLRSCRRKRENIHAQNFVFQKIFRNLQLLRILIRHRQRRIRSREAMRVHESVYVSEIIRTHQRHVAISALRRLRGIIKRPCPLPRDSASLPVVIFIEAAEPAVVIHRHIQMHLVAARTKFCRLSPHERLQKHSPMRLRIQLDQKIVQLARHRILYRGQLMQPGIFQIKVPLPHRALHVRDGVAHHAPQSRLRLGTVHDLLDRGIH